MKFLEWAKDGGPESHVTGYFLIELKGLFSIVLLNFGEGTREAFHSHAFNALTLWLKGRVKEEVKTEIGYAQRDWKAGQVKFTPKSLLHRVLGEEDAWALSLRGPWEDTWKEYLPNENRYITLTHGRHIVPAT